MTLSLREKRRQETGLQIQKETLKLAMENGLDNVTTDEIAAKSGVSTRTFFNYYPNKEAAAIGHPPAFTDSQMDALRDGTGPLAADLKQFLDSHITALSEREDIIRMVGRVLRSNDKARGILEGILAAERRLLEEALLTRVERRQTAVSLAANITNAIRTTIFLWQKEEDLTIAAALDVVWDGLTNAAEILVSTQLNGARS